MKKIFLFLIFASFLLTSCIDGDDPKPFYYGFATVDKNPLLGIVTFYGDLDANGIGDVYKPISNVDPNDKLKDGDRVYLTCNIEKDYGNRKYDVNVTSCSLDLSKLIQKNPSAPEGMKDVYINLNQAYLAVDYLKRTFINLSVTYSTKKDNSDSYVLGYFDGDQVDAPASTIVFRLMHYQKDNVDSAPNTNDVLAFNLNSIAADVDVLGKNMVYRIKYTDYNKESKYLDVKSDAK